VGGAEVAALVGGASAVVCSTVVAGACVAEADGIPDWPTVATVVRSGEGRLVTSSRTLPTADVARRMEATVASSHARTLPIRLRIVVCSAIFDRGGLTLG
jgi:hypothetical protein